MRPSRPGTIRVFFERWTSRLPLPLTTADRAGFWWDLTMRQVETPAPSCSTPADPESTPHLDEPQVTD
jgi:hypothetical protein